MRSEKGNWTSFDIQQGLLSKQVNAIAHDTNGNVWIGTKKGLNRCKSGATQLEDCAIINVLLSANIQALQLDNDCCWLACADGVLTSFNPLTKQVSALRNFGNDDLTSLALDAQNNLWVASEGGGAFWIFRDGPSSGYIQNFTAGSQQFASQFSVNADSIALGRPQAIAVNKAGNTLSQSLSFRVPHNPVMASMIVSDENYLWAGSDEEGLTLFNTEEPIQGQSKTPKSTAIGLPSRARIRSVNRCQW